MPGTLPSQRELLTNLIHALCETHHDDGSAADRAAERNCSPLEQTWESSQRKNLILTLHVIFPGMLLPALDLLDRNLVRRLALKMPSAGKERRKEAWLTIPNQQLQMQEHRCTAERQLVYTARSVASTWPRRGAKWPGGSVRMYLVHLDAWSCSCAGFTVDAYASIGRAVQTEPATGGNGDVTTRIWKFGGLSATGLDTQGLEAIPCCKHLLACLLVDEWEELLAARVEDKSCTEEELAGIVAGI